MLQTDKLLLAFQAGPAVSTLQLRHACASVQLLSVPSECLSAVLFMLAQAQTARSAMRQQPTWCNSLLIWTALPRLAACLSAVLLNADIGPEGPECDASAADLVQIATYLGGSAKVGRVNASAIDADTLEGNGIEVTPAAAGCAHRMVLKPYGEQSEPDDPFPVFEGARLLRCAGRPT